MEFYLYIGAFAVLSYLLGSIPSAVWIGRRFYKTDVRQYGSRSAGATNVLRTLGWRAALPVFLLDIVKGLAAVLLAYLIPASVVDAGSEQFGIIKIGFGLLSVVGHMYPALADFRGGKGVATTLGITFAICPMATLIALAVFTGVFSITRIVSVGSLAASVVLPIAAIFGFQEYAVAVKVFSVMICLLLIYTHRKNILRLINHTEPKTTFKR